MEDKEYYFDEENHYHYIYGKKVPGVTTICNLLNKDAIKHWNTKIVLERVKKGIEVGEHQDIQKLFTEAKNEPSKAIAVTQSIGKQFHKMVEDWIKEGKEPETKSKKLLKMFQTYKDWENMTEPGYLESELPVWDKELKVAGILDFVANINGKTYLGDFKTSNKIYKDRWLQTAAYQMMLEKTRPEIEIDGHIIVNVTRAGKLLVETNYEYERYKQGFLGLLSAYKCLYGN